jgi:3-phosphoshikimate 1-carboxyvinyltransferase
MFYTLSKPALSPTDLQVQLPASKSISNRALILNALSMSGKTIHNLAKCDDTDVLLAALRSDGNHFDIGAAGTAMRFLTAYLCLKEGEWSVTGSERMKQRPIKVLVEALRELGADVDYLENEGFPPLKIKGGVMKGGEITIDGSVSSQYISALLMIAPCLQNGLTLNFSGTIISKPYIQMTLQMMSQFGISYQWDDYAIKIVPQTYIPVDYTVESDWSASSYWYEIALLSGSGATFTLPNLYRESLQGDAHVKDIFEPLGVTTKFVGNNVQIICDKKAVGHLEYDFSEQPDLAQTVVVACCCMGTTFHFRGLQTLKIKETDRIAALMNECGKLGFKLEEPAEGELAWRGKTCERVDEPIATYKDHRMAMAFAPAALKVGTLRIADPQVVSKSYPEYWTAVADCLEIIK